MILKDFSILHADSDPGQRQSFQAYLRQQGGVYYQAAAGSEAFDLYLDHRPDIVIAGVSEALDGLALADKIKQVSRETYVIITADLNDSSQLEKALDLGLDLILSAKPVLPVLQKALQKAVAKLEQEDHYESVLEELPIPFHSLDEMGNILRVNAGFEQALGYRREEVLGKSMLALVPAGLETHFWQVLEKFKRHGQVSVDLVLQKKSGEQIDIHLDGQFLKAADGSRYSRCVWFDITERKRAERELRDSEKRFAAAFEGAAIGKALVSLQGRFQQVNASLGQLLGYTVEELQQKDFVEIIHPQDRELHVPLMRKLLLGEISVFHQEMRYLHQNGRSVWVQLSVSLVRDDNYKPLYFIFQMQDITARRQAEADMANALVLNQMILESSPAGIQIFKASGQCIMVNAMASQILGGSREQVLALDFHKIRAWRESGLYESVLQVLENGQTLRRDLLVTTTWGKKIMLDLTIGSFQLNGEKHLAMLFTDISERIQAEYALRASEEKFRNLVETTSDWIWEADRQGVLTYVSPVVQDILEYTAEELYGQSLFELFAGEEVEKFRQVYSSGQAVPVLPCTLLRKDGSRVFAEAGLTPVFDAGHKFSGYRGIIHDITEHRQLELSLRREKETIATILQMAGPLIVVLNKRGQVVRFNRTAEKITGYKISELHGRPFWEFFLLPEEKEAVKSVFDNISAGNLVERFENHWLMRDGSRRLFDWSNAVLPGTTGQQEYIVSIGIDITDRRKAERDLELAASIYNNTREAILVTDAENRIIAVNPAFTLITGYLYEECLGRDPKFMSSGRQDRHFYEKMWQEIQSNGYWQGEIWNRRKNGDLFPQWMTINIIRDKNGKINRHIAIFSDITEKKKIDDLIWAQAYYDNLTMLPNRRLFEDRLEQEIKKSHRDKSVTGLFFLDLDHFKEVNDTLGHQTGDILLQEAARRISSCVRESDTVARLGGDEFTVILPELSQRGSADRVAQAILEKLAQPFALGGRKLEVTCSIGIALYPDDATLAEELIKNADLAMYQSKKKGRNCFSYFSR